MYASCTKICQIQKSGQQLGFWLNIVALALIVATTKIDRTSAENQLNNKHTAVPRKKYLHSQLKKHVPLKIPCSLSSIFSSTYSQNVCYLKDINVASMSRMAEFLQTTK